MTTNPTPPDPLTDDALTAIANFWADQQRRIDKDGSGDLVIERAQADNARLRATLDAVRVAVASGNWTEAKELLEREP